MNVRRSYEFQSSFIEASAGTGKTYTIMEIVKDLIGKYEIPLTQILILTYTEKAAGELKERLRKKTHRGRAYERSERTRPGYDFHHTRFL